ncbi:hypothetical protein CHAN_10325 [Corynebacterium hansenii]|nr:hypothetical protein CHAN_10325 [Corynebacterium hansenii]
MDECLMLKHEAEEYADIMAGLGLIRPSDRMSQYSDAGIPAGVSL